LFALLIGKSIARLLKRRHFFSRQGGREEEGQKLIYLINRMPPSDLLGDWLGKEFFDRV
jgi:hypothetical protein